MLDSEEGLTQPELDNQRNQLLSRKELKGATFCVDLTAQGAIFHANSNNVRAVLDHIQQHHNLTIDTLFGGGFSSDTSPRFPPQGFDEGKGSCAPLVHLLNMVVRVSNESLYTLPGMSSSEGSQRCYLSRLRFHNHGIRVIGEYEDSLGPHGFGLLGELPSGGKVPFEDVEVVVEVNSQTDVLVQQAATYARRCLANNRRRFYTTAIGFNYRNLEIYFFVFHRSGLSSSRPLCLRTQRGFEDIVKHIVGMLSIRDEADYGLDVTRSPSQDILSINDRYYQVVRLLYMRQSLRGRSTVVYNLDGTILAYLEHRA